MGKPTGFLEIKREKPARRPVPERIHDWREYELAPSGELLGQQAARCMDCGVPFCHQGCPLGNLIPEWNDLMYRGRPQEALERLHATNNFPEFTGHVCPAPCEESCVLNLRNEPVTIKAVERTIVDRAWEAGEIRPQPPARATGRSVAVVGSGPAGLACAQQLARAGHAVTVFERADRLGGLLRYGIPDFKLEKWRIDRRLEQMRAEGVHFRTGVEIGRDETLDGLRSRFDAVVLATGAARPRDLEVPGRDLAGIHLAMTYLEQCNRTVAGETVPDRIDARDRHVVILGGGDTGADCLGSAHRQGCASVRQIELLPAPPESRTAEMPWPWWPMLLRTAGAHEEGGERAFAIRTTAFLADASGRVRALQAVRVAWTTDASGRKVLTDVPGSVHEIPCDLVFLAMGFTGPETTTWRDAEAPALDARGNVHTASDGWQTSVPGVFACGDVRRGASLVVWAIAEGRETATAVDRHLATRG